MRAGYDELARRATTVAAGELGVRVLGYDDLIATKRAAGEAADLADISALEAARSRSHSPGE